MDVLLPYRTLSLLLLDSSLSHLIFLESVLRITTFTLSTHLLDDPIKHFSLFTVAILFYSIYSSLCAVLLCPILLRIAHVNLLWFSSTSSASLVSNVSWFYFSISFFLFLVIFIFYHFLFSSLLSFPPLICIYLWSISLDLSIHLTYLLTYLTPSLSHQLPFSLSLSLSNSFFLSLSNLLSSPLSS